MDKTQTKIEESVDDSQDEQLECRIGKIPSQYYKSKSHIGYNIKGEKVIKNQNNLQNLNPVDKIISLEENNDYWRFIEDELNNKQIRLTDQQLNLVKKIKEKSFINEFIKNKDFSYVLPTNQFPMSHETVPKKNYQPSISEQKQIKRIIKAIQRGLIKPEQLQEEQKDLILSFISQAHEQWTNNYNNKINQRLPQLVPPKLELPKDELSYNYNRKGQIFLRQMENPKQMIQDQFERLLYLYLAPRTLKKKIQMSKDQLLQELPRIQDLRPFPTRCYISHQLNLKEVSCIDISPNDLYLVTGDFFGEVQILNSFTGLVFYKQKFEQQKIVGVKFINQNLLMIVAEKSIQFLNLKMSRQIFNQNQEIFFKIHQDFVQNQSNQNSTNNSQKIDFSFPFFNQNGTNQKNQNNQQTLLQLNFKDKLIKAFDLHFKGDYLSLLTEGPNRSIQLEILSISKCKTVKINLKGKQSIQHCIFHPKKPQLSIMSRQRIVQFDVQKQQILKKLKSNSKALTFVSYYKNGEHLLASSSDQQLEWFDVGLSDKPFKQFKVHQSGVNKCKFSKNYNLFGSCDGDGKIVIQHCYIEEGALSEPRIIPLRILESRKKVGVCDFQFFENKHYVATINIDGFVEIWS